MRKLIVFCALCFLGFTTQLAAQSNADTSIAWNVTAERSSDTSLVVTIQALPKQGLALFGFSTGSTLSSTLQIDSLSRALSPADVSIISGKTLAIQLPDDTVKYNVYSDTVVWKLVVTIPANRKGWLTGSINWLGKMGDTFPSNTYTFRVAVPVSTSATTTSGGWWQIFLICFLTGLVAVITPCVFPLIPVTVSFFLKKSETKQAGWRNALWYSISIVLIYTIPTLLLTLIFGDSILYRISVSPVSNILFFLIFLVFAISFFGAFEISLPNSWANKADQKAGKIGRAHV